MIRQETDWGEILWLTENEEDKELLSIQGLQVGIVSLFPGENQSKHIHYDEQVIWTTIVSRWRRPRTMKGFMKKKWATES